MSALVMPPSHLEDLPTWQQAIDYARRICTGTGGRVRIHKALNGTWEVWG